MSPLVNNLLLPTILKKLSWLIWFPDVSKNRLLNLWKFANLINPGQRFGLLTTLVLFCISFKNKPKKSSCYTFLFIELMLGNMHDHKKPPGNSSHGSKPNDCSLTRTPQIVRIQCFWNTDTTGNICKQENTICTSHLFMYSLNWISACANNQSVE